MTSSARREALEPLEIHHVAVVVSELQPAIDFYTAVLGMKLRSDRPDVDVRGAWLDVGDQQLHLVVAGPRQEPVVKARAAAFRTMPHFTLRVDDLMRSIEGLRTHGIDVSDALAIGRGWQAFLSDPSGNIVELLESAPLQDPS